MFYGKVCYKMNKDFFCDYYRMTGKKWGGGGKRLFLAIASL